MKRLAGGAPSLARARASRALVAGGDAPRAQASARRRRHRGRRAARPGRPRDLAGTLGYADAGTLAAGVSGTLTALREPGRDHHPRPLAVRGRRQAGRVPALRRPAGLARLRRLDDRRRGRPPARAQPARARPRPGHRRRRLGLRHDRGGQALPGRRELDEDGTLSRGEILFRPGAMRIGEAKATVGDQASPGRPLADDLLDRAARDRRARRAPPATRARGRPGHRRPAVRPHGDRADRGRRARSRPRQARRSSIEVTITLSGRSGSLDQAPVDVGFAVERRKGVLAVPVKALLARQGGGYAVELTDGRLVNVEPGLYADDMVEVEGDGLREGAAGGDGAMSRARARRRHQDLSRAASRRCAASRSTVARGRGGRGRRAVRARASRRCCT